MIAFSPSASPGGGEHDTAALLAAARELDLGWRALARGDLAAARCALERAEPLAPGSARAALACADLAEATARAGNE